MLTGQPPAALRDQFAAVVPIPAGPSEVAIGTPSDLVNRRADVRLAALQTGQPKIFGGASNTMQAPYKEVVLHTLEEAENAKRHSKRRSTRPSSSRCWHANNIARG